MVRVRLTVRLPLQVAGVFLAGAVRPGPVIGQEAVTPGSLSAWRSVVPVTDGAGMAARKPLLRRHAHPASPATGSVGSRRLMTDRSASSVASSSASEALGP